MEIAVRVEPTHEALPPVDYRWDVDTDILTAAWKGAPAGDGMSGAVEVEGSDGSWLVFDVAGGIIAGVEVAVWPDVRTVVGFAAPTDAVAGRVTIPARRSQPGVASFELDTQVAAHTDAKERTIHFRIGVSRTVRHVRIAKDILLDIDEREHLAGVWLLNVPPAPAD